MYIYTHTHIHRKFAPRPPSEGPPALCWGPAPLKMVLTTPSSGGRSRWQHTMHRALYPQNRFAPLGSSSSSRRAWLTFPGRLPLSREALPQRRLPLSGFRDSVLLWMSGPPATVAAALEPGSTWTRTRYRRTPPSRPS